MQCYTELVPPTAVAHATSLPFLAPQAHNLVVAKSSILQIFEFKSIVTEVDSGLRDDFVNGTADGPDIALQRTEHTTKLVLVGEYSLSGTAISLARIKALNTKSGAEALIVAFRDAKLSLVEWDPENHSISTVSLHFYEAEELQGAPWAPDPSHSQNFVTVDPSSRCAALKFGGRQLAILPFRQLGDDLVEGDYDPDLDEPMDDAHAKESTLNTLDEKDQTPYSSSFVLPLTALDPTLTHPIHLAFLYEYREPTFGILSSSSAPAASLLPIRQDNLNYTVFTLDLDQRASTAILSISGLPYDVSRVLPLPLPVGGALLIGGNELIHVDQAGKTNAVAVNEFARQCSTFPMADQSELSLRLESCIVEQLSADSGDMLLVLNTGELAVLSFKLDGRTVSGLSVFPVTEERGGLILQTLGSCSANIGRNRMFVGSEDGDSSIIGWTRRTAQLTRKRSQVEMLTDDPDLSFDEDDLDDYDDDLYGSTAPPVRQASISGDSTSPGNYTFRIHDTLPNFGPIKAITLSSPLRPLTDNKQNGTLEKSSTAELVTASGRGKAGSLGLFRREIDPTILRESKLATSQAIWSVHAKKPMPKGLVSQGKQDSEATYAADAEYDQYVICSALREDGSEESDVYATNGTNIEETQKGNFESDAGATIEVGTLANGTRIVQVLQSEVRTYESELDLAQIFFIEEDQETEAEPKFVSASFADPYLLILRDDSTAIVLEAAENGEIEQLDRDAGFASTKWLSGCLYKSSNDSAECLMYLLGAEGGLKVYELPNLAEPVYTVDSLAYLLPVMTPDFTPRRAIAKATLTELLVADLGDSTAKSPYLILRTSNDDLVIYQPYHFPKPDVPTNFTTNLRWLKIFQPQLAKYSEESGLDMESASRQTTLRSVSNVGGYRVVFQTGVSPCFIIKEASGLPRVLNLRGLPVRGFSSFHTGDCDRGFAYVDSKGDFKVGQLPLDFRYSVTGWATRKVQLQEEIDAFCYHPPDDVYILATSNKVDFSLPKDDQHHQDWAKEATSFPPQIDQGSVKMLHPKTWSIIDSHDLDTSEVVLCMESVELEVSEKTHQRKQLVAFGTAIVKGEDLAARGRVYVLEVMKVVPEPDRPETDRKLKLLIKEEVRGAVTSLSSIGGHGLIVMAHGQKCMVRGMREEGLLPPVAFLDVQCYITSIKELKGTGMFLMGDAARGLWFAGFTVEPYRMPVFGKGRTRMEVMAVDFLPFGNQLYIVAADMDENIHVMQFDPEHPKSLSGQRLIHKSTFHIGHFPSQLTLLPGTVTAASSTGAFDPAVATNGDAMVIDGEGDTQSHAPIHHLLLTTQTGSIGLLTPVHEAMYRRLSTLQTYLTNQLDHACGLNPRSYRAAESEGFGSRGIVDGTLLRRWCELGSQRATEACAKVGVEEWVLRSDLEFVGGAGLAYL